MSTVTVNGTAVDITLRHSGFGVSEYPTQSAKQHMLAVITSPLDGSLWTLEVTPQRRPGRSGYVAVLHHAQEGTRELGWSPSLGLIRETAAHLVLGYTPVPA